MEKSFPLDKLIDLEELQSIQDSFARAVGISSVIFSAEDEPLTRFTNPTRFCSLIQSTKKGKERCFRSFMETGKNALESEKPKIFYCFAHGGHFVAPIMIDGEYKGTMFAGQFIPEKFSAEQLHDLEKIAPEIDLDPGLLVKEAGKMRVVGEDVIRDYSSLLFKIVETITRRSAQVAELIMAKDALQKAHDGLEKRVQERTAELAEANKGLKHEITERKLAEEALQKERDKTQHYLDVAAVMLLVIGADRKVTLINKKGCEILGYEKEKEITGKDWFDNFVPERLRDEVAAVFNLLVAGEIEPVEYYENPVLTKHGEGRIVTWHNTILRDERGRIYATMASGEDITERKRAEEALRESELRYRSLTDDVLDASSVGIFILDSDFQVVWVNQALECYFGLRRKEIIGKDKRQLIRERIKDIFEDPVYFTEKVFATYDNNTYIEHFECHIVPDSEREERWLEHWSQPILSGLYAGGRIEHYSDITERKKAEEKLIPLLAVVKQSSEGMAVANLDGILTFANNAWCKMHGYKSSKELLGKNLAIFHNKEQLENEVKPFNEKVKQDGAHSGEVGHITKDGKPFPTLMGTTLLKDEQGKPYALVGIARDITERKRMEKALNDRVCFEKIVASISTSFINLAPDEIDIGIEDALGSIGEFFGVDRSYLFRLFDDGTKTDNTHEWCAEGIVPQIENLKGLQTADFPWFLGRLNRFETVHIPSVADLSPEADCEKEILQSGGIQSAILVPMVYGGTLVGFIGLDSVKQEKSWSEENIALLRIICEIFVNALERKRVMDALRSSETKFHAMFEKNPLGAVIIDKERKIREVNDTAVAMVGRSREEIIGRTRHEFICPIAENDCPIYDHGLIIDHAEGILISKDRGEVPIEKTATQITVDGDTMILEMFYDITKRKAAEEEIKEKADELEKFNRLAVGREFKMIELKKEINALLEKLGKEPGYKIVGDA